MSAAQLRLVEPIDAFYGASERSSDGTVAAHAYKSNVTTTLRDTISKVRKLTDKPSDDPTKLPRCFHLDMQAQQELDEAKEIFELLNDQLIREIPILLEQRVPFFDPSFEAMIRMQCKFAEEGYEKLSGVQRARADLLHRYLGDSIRDDYAAG
ncbi:hypothetical protein EVG20_g9421 [Dentipellis fragilis]|uniref:BAR domain-containing protein n=1 Tax=Dentipellis fragilis TaxID=205917 RepID=A0A4Y9Y2W5_9AGAM|nr:hypothetical protein EVG20_g9421 [Dentipellis fragilis]